MAVLGATVASAIGLPAGAQGAATLTLGSSLPPTNAGLACGCTLIQPAGANPSVSFVSPVDGVITRWRVRHANYGPGADESLGLALRVLRSNGGTSYTGIATSALGRPRTVEIETFPTHLAISAGEYIGIDDPEGLFLGDQTAPGASFGEIKPLLADGTTTSATLFENEAIEFNADILPTPTIALLTPAGATAPEQTTIGILGTNFEEVEAVAIGGKPAASYTARSESLITATIASGLSPGKLEVTVTTPAGTASSTFDYAAPAPPAPPGPVAAVTPMPTSAKACTVPQLRGRSLKAAKRRVLAAGCKVGKLRKRGGARARTGTVVAQKPEPGTAVPVGTGVKITLGPAPPRLPSIRSSVRPPGSR